VQILLPIYYQNAKHAKNGKMIILLRILKMLLTMLLLEPPVPVIVKYKILAFLCKIQGYVLRDLIEILDGNLPLN